MKKEITRRTAKLKDRMEGITLVALVITVIIMLILAGVALSLITGEEGLFASANRSAQIYKDASQEEVDILDSIIRELDKYSDLPELPELPITTTEFSRANGVIDIIWLNTDDTVRTKSEGPLSPKDHLGGLTAVKYSNGAWETANADNISNEWYEYVAQTGNTETGGTSNWANAKIETEDGKTAYFVWIPRYAYKITYFSTPEQAEAYRTSGSTEGIVGYSTIQGMIDVTSGEAKIVEGTEPTNVEKRVRSTEYADYIPHPAFEFNGPEAGIWVAKYMASGSITAIEFKEDTSTLWGVTESEIFTKSKAMRDTYGLSGDTHLIKNTEWGAVAYLTESKYGRNGTEIIQNKTQQMAGGGDYIVNKLQSSTGNEYGIYDLSGCGYEFVAAYVNNDDVKNNGYNTNLVEADKKYKDVYAVGAEDSDENNYEANRGMKGDAVYEVSTSYTGNACWHGDIAIFPNASTPVFVRTGGHTSSGTNAGVFLFNHSSGHACGNGFRVVLIS